MPKIHKQKQIPCGNDKQKQIPCGNDKRKQIPCGNDKQKQIPCGNDKQKLPYIQRLPYIPGAASNPCMS